MLKCLYINQCRYQSSLKSQVMADWRKKTKRLLKYFVLALSLLLLASCTPGVGDVSHRVRLAVPSGVSVKSENPIMVADGESAVFELAFGSTVAFRSLSEGNFDPETKTATLENVSKDTSIELTAENVGYDTTIKYQFSYIGSTLARASVDNGAMVFAGTEVVLTAADRYSKFVGWRLGNYMDKGGQLISEEREYAFEISPAVVANGSGLTVYVNYIESNVYYIDPNGGNIATGTVNLVGNSYYKTSNESGRLKVALQEQYYNKVGCASLFWDDGSFVRNGHVLLEYNTKPDGTGEGYSLGSKFSLNSDISVIYCIWAEYTPENQFSYQTVSIPKPDKVISSNWNTEGVKITGYSGTADRVVIPEKIAAKPILLSESIMDTEFLAYLNSYIAECERRGAEVVFSYPPMNSAAISEDSDSSAFEKFLIRNLDCRVISYIDDYIMSPGYFYDTNFHLGEVGAVVRTRQLAIDLGYSSAADIEIPSVPPLPIRDTLFDGYDENEKYFIYETLENGGKRIVGLTDDTNLRLLTGGGFASSKV